MVANVVAENLAIEKQLWERTRAGARSGRGFRYQDAVAAWLAVLAWKGKVQWNALVPEGVDDITLHGADYEFRVQLKSRHDPQEFFTQTEVISYLTKAVGDLPADWLESPRIHIAIVLERKFEELQPTGWELSLAESGQSLTFFEASLAAALPNQLPSSISELLRRIHLVTESNPIVQGCESLDTVQLPPAAKQLVIQRLRELAGEAADKNYLAPAEKPAVLGQSDVQSIIDAVQGIIDPSSYLALTSGLVELADFGVSVASPSFYEGLNVAPSHVGAGLVFPRRELIEETLTGLAENRFALVVGPSGSGKSALAWLTAHQTRHSIRWYRVRSLQTSDVAKLSQLAKLLDASPSRPIGFVVDDVGNIETVGWDLLVKEVESQEGIYAIGTVREEDVFLLSTATRSPQIRPVLNEELAHQIWQALTASGRAKFSHWREPFELSGGLLLEFTHLLTAGKRIEQTLCEQVRRRLAENRDDELLLLRAIAFAGANGAAVDKHRLLTSMSFSEPRFAKALQRLLDEHVVRALDDGSISGLHEIRSSFLDSAILDLFGDQRCVAIEAATKTLQTRTLNGYIARVLRKWPEEEDSLLRSLADRMRGADVQDYIAVFHGLGLATVDRIAGKWVEICRSENIEERYFSIGFMLSLSRIDIDSIPLFKKINTARRAFDEIPVPDFRSALISMIPGGIDLPPLGMAEGHELVAALLPVSDATSNPVLKVVFDDELASAPLAATLEVLTTLRELSLERAMEAVETLGGANSLLERIYQEWPWSTRPTIGESDGIRHVEGYVRIIGDEVQPDMNASVVALCDAMAAAVPDAELFISTALLPDGEPFVFDGIDPHRKRMPRSAVAAPARVAWNRAIGRSISRLVAAKDETSRTTSIAKAIVELGSRLPETCDLFCRGETASDKLKLFLSVRNLLTTFIPPEAVDEAASSPLALGKLYESDKLHSFVTGLQDLMIAFAYPGTKKPQSLAMQVAQLISDVEHVKRPELWRMTNQSPVSSLVQIQEALQSVRVVLGVMTANPGSQDGMIARFRRRSRSNPILARAAKEASTITDDLIVSICDQLKCLMRDQDLAVEVFFRSAPKDDGIFWPNIELCVVLEVNRIEEWLNTIEQYSRGIRNFPTTYKVLYGAAINKHLVPFAFSFVNQLIPYEDFGNDWHPYTPYHVINDGGLTLFDQLLGTVELMSAISCEGGRELNLQELKFLVTLQDRLNQGLRKLGVLLDGNADDELVQAFNFVTAAAEFVDEELGGSERGRLARELTSGFRGTPGEFTLYKSAVRFSLIERAALRGAADPS